MRNTAILLDYDNECVEVDLDTVTSIGKSRGYPCNVYINIGHDHTTYTIPSVEGQDDAVTRENLISRWRHGHGRPEIIEVFNDTEGPKNGYGRELLDLSTCSTFSCNTSIMWGPTITCRFYSKDARSQVFFVKRDECITEEQQCAEIESLWRKARGER